MLFISILLSVWFVIWLMHAIFVKNAWKVFVAWMRDIYDEEDEDIDPLLEKSEEGVTHLSCSECGYLWWSIEPFPNFCPHCGADRRIKAGENK